MVRFTIRDVPWLTVVVALGMGWFMNRHVLIQQSVRRDKANYELRIFVAAREYQLQAFVPDLPTTDLRAYERR